MKNDVYWNKTERPIFITLDFEANPSGGPAKSTTHICVMPGQGIDFACYGFTRKKPKTSKTRNFSTQTENGVSEK